MVFLLAGLRLPGVLDRFGQITPKVLIAADGYTWNGKPIDTRPRLAEIARALDGLDTLVVFPFLDDAPVLDAIPGAVAWDDYLDNGAEEIDFRAQPFDHPLYILYSSGTTGTPKCIVHSAGGTLLQHLKEHRLHTDLDASDTLFYYTTCGWMMWNWLVSGLASGATLVLFDGAAFAPDAEVLWRIAEHEASRCSAPVPLSGRLREGRPRPWQGSRSRRPARDPFHRLGAVPRILRLCLP